jgi:hypothetical protein
MSPPTPPANVLPYLQEAAKGTGLPLAIVEAQNYAETGYGSNEGPSSAGAEGPWQFEPQTWAQGGYSGSITSWADSTKAYISFMNSLLKSENGNVENALAAYNAGPGNIQAGMGYAQGIIAAAGGGTPSTDNGGSGAATTPSSSSTGSSVVSDIAGLGQIGSAISGLAKDFDDVSTAFGHMIDPSFWLRIGMFLAGAALLIAAIYTLIKGNSSSGGGSIPIPLPIPV